MHFLNPIALFGLTAAAIPLIIHLLHRGRTTPLPFSNLAFLHVVHQQRMRRLQLRQWLALLLRTLAILFAVAAFARPAFRAAGGGGGLFGSSPAPTRALILIDRSYSTSYRTPGGRLFDRIREDVVSLMDLFAPGDEVSFAAFADRAHELGASHGGDADGGMGILNRLTVSEGATRIDLALQYAERHFSEEQTGDGRSNWNRETFLFTDRAQHNWDEARPHPADATRLPGVRVYVNDMGDLRERSNTFVESLDVDRWMATPGHVVELRALVVNASSRPLQAVPVDLYVDGERRQRRVVDLPEQSHVEVAFSFTPRRPGLVSGYVETDEDALPLDNRRYFSLHVADAIRILLVGAPRDVYYPRRALDAAGASDPALHLLPTASPDGMNADSKVVDIVALCSVERLSRNDARTLHRFVSAGGGLIIFPPPDVDLSLYNRHLLPELLPASLVGLGRRAGVGTTVAQTLDAARSSHPLLADLMRSADDNPSFASFFEIAAGDHVEPLAFFENGRPALVLGHRGRGATVLSSFPLDLSWSDLPVKGMFAPLMHRLCRYLNQPGQQLTPYTVGQAVRRRMITSARDGAVQVEGPSGKRLFIEAKQDDGQQLWTIPAVDEAGIWKVFENGDLVSHFAVNVDTRESLLAPVRTDVVEELFDAALFRHLVGSEKGALANLVLAQRYGSELWRPCLVAAAFMLLMELWIARAPQQQRELGATP